MSLSFGSSGRGYTIMSFFIMGVSLIFIIGTLSSILVYTFTTLVNSFTQSYLAVFPNTPTQSYTFKIITGDSYTMTVPVAANTSGFLTLVISTLVPFITAILSALSDPLFLGGVFALELISAASQL
ncbi:MAG: hypothetical protein QW575_07990 [Thermoproteota archaeon]